ncbi:hypothetical protein EJX10_10290 [Neisseria gonorrhoeae]
MPSEGFSDGIFALFTVILKSRHSHADRNPDLSARKLMRRHSREGGNPDRSVSVISDKFLLLFIPRFPLSRE